MAKLEVGIVLRVAPGAPPVVVGAVTDKALLRHALRAAIINAAAVRPCTRNDAIAVPSAKGLLQQG
jgi:hypothetical protein